MKPNVSSKIRVLLVDDHPFVLEGIKACLAGHSNFEIVGEASSGHEGIRKTEELSPDVVVMDVSMPGMNGLETTKYLRKSFPETRILMLTCYDTKEFIAQIIHAGAQGYLPKNSSTSELATAIETVGRGEIYFSPTVSAAFFQDFVRSEGRVEIRQTPTLTHREREVVQLIVNGLCNKEIAGQLNLSVRTIEKHRERIMAKLNVHNVVQLIRSPVVAHMLQPGLSL